MFKYTLGLPTTSPKVAAFDLDWTIVKPKSGNKFPKDKDDWCFLNDKVVPTLQKLSSDGHTIVIFTNQGSKDFTDSDFQYKLNNIYKVLNVPFDAYACTEKGVYRKPCIGMWETMLKSMNGINTKESFYVGDAAGRPKDFSDSDIKFAINIGIKFMVPEEIFYGKKVIIPIPVHPLISGSKDTVDVVMAREGQEMIILVGPPAAGKSSFCRKECFSNYIVANQDTLKTKAKVITTLKKALANKKSVIVDRKNEYIKDRKEFLELAKTYNVPVRVVFFDVPREICEHLNVYRGIKTSVSALVPAIVYNKYYSTKCGLEMPELSEGFESIEVVHFKIEDKDKKKDKLLNMFLV